jgi:hypothetical protein
MRKAKAIKDPKWPENGFYYHYNRDPNGDVNNGAYQVVGVGRNRASNLVEVEYLPLYERPGVNPRERCHASLRKFMGSGRRGGELVQRFVRVTDEVIIARLEYLRDQMFKRAVTR